VGNQGSLRRVNGQKTGVAPETSGQKRSATTASLQRRRSLLFQLLARGFAGALVLSDAYQHLASEWHGADAPVSLAWPWVDPL
jgi:hypothetical protein